MSDLLYFTSLRLFRWYALHSPVEKGRWRAMKLVALCGRKIRGEHEMVVNVDDGRRFAVDPREPQYLMDLLPMNVHEEAESRLLALCLEPGAVALDVGANFGWFTTLFSRSVGAGGAVHAFEPVPVTRQTLERNLRMNGCSNVHVHNVALFDAPGRTTLRIAPNRASGDASMFAGTGDGVAFECEVDTLDRCLLGRLTRCDLVKCDVEGAETRVLRGAKRTLEKFRPTLLIEINRAAFTRAETSGAEALAELVRLGGYLFYAVLETGRIRRFDADAPPEDRRGYFNALCLPEGSPAIAKVAQFVDRG